MTGYIKTFRKMLEWEWYKDIPVRILFEHCLLKANYKEKKWQGVVINPGSFVTSYENLAFETGLTVQQVRTALNKLKSTSEITCKSTSRYSIIIINNWDYYQEDNKQINNQITNNQQTINKQSTTTKEREESKEVEEVVGENFSQQQLQQENQKIYGIYQNVCLTESQYKKLLGVCMSAKLLNELIDDLSKKIGYGAEKPYKAELPEAHFIRLMAYYEQRRKHPEKFRNISPPCGENKAVEQTQKLLQKYEQDRVEAEKNPVNLADFKKKLNFLAT